MAFGLRLGLGLCYSSCMLEVSHLQEIVHGRWKWLDIGLLCEIKCRVGMCGFIKAILSYLGKDPFRFCLCAKENRFSTGLQKLSCSCRLLQKVIHYISLNQIITTWCLGALLKVIIISNQMGWNPHDILATFTITCLTYWSTFLCEDLFLKDWEQYLQLYISHVFLPSSRESCVT